MQVRILVEKNIVTLANYVYVANCRILDGNVIEHARLSHGNPARFHEIVQRRFEFDGDTLILYPLNLESKDQRKLKCTRQ